MSGGQRIRTHGVGCADAVSAAVVLVHANVTVWTLRVGAAGLRCAAGVGLDAGVVAVDVAGAEAA